MKTVEVLIKAKELIKDPLNWNQGDYYVERNGLTCYCGLGAIAAVLFEDADSCVSLYVDVHRTLPAKLLQNVVYGRIALNETFAPFNDSHTHAEVMQAFDQAIELAQKTEALTA